MVWSQTAESLTGLKQPKFKAFHSRTVRERYKVLEKLFKKLDNEDRRASGQAQNKMKSMMQCVVSLKRLQKCFMRLLKKKKEKEQEVLQAEEMRHTSLETFGETRKRTKSKEAKSNEKHPKS
eukprot:gene10557-11678_t